MPRLSAAIAAFCIGLAAAAPAKADSIYDAKIEQKLTMTASQRPKIVKILDESGRQARAVMKKYGIDPDARPVFDKLKAASTELLAVSRWEREQMEKILSDDQLDQYDRIVNETKVRVRKAAQ